MPITAEAGPVQPLQSVSNCLTRKDVASAVPGKPLGEFIADSWFDSQHHLTSTKFMSKLEERQGDIKRELCERVVAGEQTQLLYGGLMSQPLYCALNSTKAAHEVGKKDAMASVVEACARKLGIDDLMKLPALREAHARIAAAEAKEDETKQARADVSAKERDRLNIAAQQVRNFQIKGLGLALSREALLSMNSKGQRWNCQPDRRYLDTEICVAKFAVETCYPVEQQVAGGLLARKTTQCDTTFVQLREASPGMKDIATVAGEQVSEVQVSFYRGEAIRISYFLSKDTPELKSGLIEKYGEPTTATATQGRQWLGKDETLMQYGAQVEIFRPSLTTARNQRTTELQRAQSASQQEAEAAKSERKKKDI